MVTTHIYHPDVMIHGLQADCPRCQEHAAAPEALTEDLQLLILTYPKTSLDFEARDRLLERSSLVDPWVELGMSPSPPLYPPEES